MTENEQILKSMRALKAWMLRQVNDFDWLLRQKQNIEYYQHQTAQLLKRVEVLEEKLKGR